MLRSSLDENMLAILIVLCHIVERDLSHSSHDNPVFVAINMALVAEALPGLHIKAFDLCVLLVVKNEKAAPWAVESILVGHSQASNVVRAKTKSYHHRTLTGTTTCLFLNA
jgi:hypothetical protein